MIRKAGVIFVVIFVLGSLAAEAQFYTNPGNFVYVSQTQLGNLGYTRYRGFGARALGMGGAYIALADDLTAASWNPAGLAQILTPSVSAGLAYADLDADQHVTLNGDWNIGSSHYGQRMENPFSFSGSDSEDHVDYFAASYPFQLSEKWALAISGSYFRSLVFDQDLSQPFGSNIVRFPRYDNSGQPIQDPSLQTRYEISNGVAAQHRSGYLDSYALSAAVSYKDTLYLGLTVSRMDGSLSGNDSFWEQGQFYLAGQEAAYFSSLEASSNMRTDLSMDGWSMAIGALVRLPKGWRIGAVYKPGYTLETDGTIIRNITVDATRGNTQNEEGLVRTYNFHNADVDYPESLGIGVAWEPTIRWTFALDYTRTTWANTELDGQEAETGSSIRMTFPSLMVLQSGFGSTKGYEQHDSSVWRMGAEYRMNVHGVDIPVRAGVFKETAYRNVPGVGDGLDITGVTAGIGIGWRHWKLDIAAVYEDADQDLGAGTTFQEPRIPLQALAGQNQIATYRYANGNSMSQSSYRVLMNVTYLF